jgi:hypothetical protein
LRFRGWAGCGAKLGRKKRLRAPEQVIRRPPFICFEIFSKDDTLDGLQDRIDDYLKFGARSRRAWVCTGDGIVEAKHGVLKTESPALVVPRAEFLRLSDI